MGYRNVDTSESTCGMCHRRRYCPYCSGSLNGRANGYKGICHVTTNEHRANLRCHGSSEYTITTGEVPVVTIGVNVYQLVEEIGATARDEEETITVNNRTKDHWFRKWTDGVHHTLNRGKEFNGDIKIRNLKMRIEQWAHRHQYQPTVTVLTEDTLLVKMISKVEDDDEDIDE